jgi:hypothetical protein
MYIPPRRPRFAPSGAIEKPAANASAHADPRDGATPPPLPTDSPANPVAIAQLLSGNPNVTEANVAAILGAPVAQLIRDKSSILYAGRRGTKSSGAADTGKDAAMASTFVPTAKGATKAPSPAPVTPVAEKPSPVDPLAWVLVTLAASGVRCAEWTAMSDLARINTVYNFFYPTQALQQSGKGGPARPSLPTDPQTLVDAISAACGASSASPARVASVDAPGSHGPASREQAAAWWAQMRAVGITCDQWYNTDRQPMPDGRRYLGERLSMIQSLIATGRLTVTPPWTGVDVFYAVDGECQRSVEPAAADPAASIRARLRAILDCGVLDTQDKLQQVAVIQRAFPEFIRDQGALYRLALARYDGCHSPSEPGWNGRGDRYVFDPEESVRWGVQHGATDVLGGDTSGMSWVQWVKQGGYMESGSPDLFDPMQGAVGDCYFVSSMASVAWARPDAIARNGIAIAPDRRRFNFGGVTIEVSDRTPCSILAGFQPIFARGYRPNDQWPGVMEKAYATFRSPNQTDRPAIPMIDNESVAVERATSATLYAIPLLAGGSMFWHLTYFRSDDAMFDLLATYCAPSGRARVPIVAGTYRSGGFVDRTGLVPNHAYSVLGFGFHADGRKFVVLRNPWGSSYAGLPSSGFTVPVVGRWLGLLSLNNGDGGCFALAHGAFSAAFQYIFGAQ